MRIKLRCKTAILYIGTLATEIMELLDFVIKMETLTHMGKTGVNVFCFRLFIGKPNTLLHHHNGMRP